MPTTNAPSKSAKSWLKVTIDTPREGAEPIAAFITALTGSGVEYAEQPGATSSPVHEKIIGYIVNDQNRPAREKLLRDFLTNISASLPDLGAASITLHTEIIEDEDWNKVWKQHFKPLQMTPRLVIKPTWEPYEPHSDEAVIEMDPGMAFGTGHHASTQLALECIESLFFSAGTLPKSVLDVGTGTGILGMACAKFGAKKIVAIDNDQDAVQIAAENVANNGLADIMVVSNQDLSSVAGPFDLIVANITHDILKSLAPHITRLLATSGSLILSGLLRGEQQESIRATYEHHHLILTQTKTLEEWASLLFSKPKRPPKN